MRYQRWKVRRANSGRSLGRCGGSPYDPQMRKIIVDSSPADSDPAAVPGLAELFLAFALMSLSGFGGVLVFARRARRAV